MKRGLFVIGILMGGLALLTAVTVAAQSRTKQQPAKQQPTTAPAPKTPQGRTRDLAIVLLPLPFDQESDEFTLTSTNNTVWFLFYARASQTYSFLFPHPPKARAGLKADIEGPDGAVRQTLPIVLSDTNIRQSRLDFTAPDNGNHYLRVSLVSNGPYRGRFVYLSEVARTRP